MSKKRREQYAVYYPLRAQYMADHPKCERCGRVPSRDIHHKAGRVGEMLNRVEFWAAICRRCHQEIHDNGRVAREQGWLI